MTEAQRVWALAKGHWAAATLLCWWLYPVTIADTLAWCAPKELRGLRFERLEALDVGSRRFAICRCQDGGETR